MRMRFPSLYATVVLPAQATPQLALSTALHPDDVLAGSVAAMPASEPGVPGGRLLRGGQGLQDRDATAAWSLAGRELVQRARRAGAA